MPKKHGAFGSQARAENSRWLFNLALPGFFRLLVSHHEMTTANWLVRRFGIEPREELSSARTADELVSMVRRSATLGSLEQDTRKNSLKKNSGDERLIGQRHNDS